MLANDRHGVTRRAAAFLILSPKAVRPVVFLIERFRWQTEGGCEFGRLTSAAELCVLAKGFQFFGILDDWLDRCPDRTGSDRVYTDAHGRK